MNDLVLEQFIELIANYTGLQIRRQDREAVWEKVWVRIKALRLSSAEIYYQILEANTQESQNEWRELILGLTTTESYFFRDSGQFSLLKNAILPELIDYKKNLQNTLDVPRTLRIWSAGCSTGEEPYSLAILLQELIPDWQQWNLMILGTDINEKALEKAKEGIYSSWSFRLVDDELQKQFFNEYKNGWKIADRFRSSVTFRYFNLVKDELPQMIDNLYNIDLIICRNVFVYFESKFISMVLKKFYQALRPGGYLITGHAELYSQNIGQFQVRIFPESVVYQRQEHNNPLVLPSILNLEKQKEATKALVTFSPPQSETLKFNPDTEATIPPPLTAKNKQEIAFLSILQEAEALFHNKVYTEAIKKAEQVIEQSPKNFDAYYLLAQIYANLGEYEQSIQHCKRAIEVDSMSVFPYYLLAHIAEEQGDLERAKILLKKIIYLSPYSVYAYLRIGDIYEKEKNLNRAKKMYITAGELLKNFPINTLLENQGKITTKELLDYVVKALKKLSYNYI